jgi:vacuolar-type H+-ATPase subunit C/Vma6
MAAAHGEILWSKLLPGLKGGSDVSQEVDYLNARVRGMMSRLLDHGRLEAAKNAPDIPGWADALKDTAYPVPGGRLDLSTIPSLYQLIDSSLWQRTHHLARIPSGRLASATALLLAERDLENILAVFTTITRHIALSSASETIRAGGLLSPAQLDELMRAGDLKEAADRLSTWGYFMHQPVRDAVRQARDTDLSNLRIQLARNYLARMKQEAARLPYPIVTRYIGRRIDVMNLGTGLLWRTLPSDRDPGELFIDGGLELHRDLFTAMLGADDEEAAIGLAGRGWIRQAAERAMVARQVTGRVSSITETLEEEICRRFTRPMASDPLGLELTLSYLLQLAREGRLLKLALTRISAGLSAGQFAEVMGNV